MGTFQIVVADVSSNLQEYWYTIYKQDDFFAMPGYILQLMGCYLADLVDYGSKSWILGCMSEYMSVRCASHLGKDARPCWKLKQKCLKTEIWKIGFGYFLIFRTCKNCWPGYICMSWSHLRPGHADISWPAIPICSWLYLYCIPIGQYIPEPYKLKQTCESPWLKHICMSWSQVRPGHPDIVRPPITACLKSQK